MTMIAPKGEIETGIDAAIGAVGGKQAFLAEKLGCAQQTVSKLRSGEIPMTADWALRIERAAAGAVPAHKLVPALAQRPAAAVAS